MILAQHLDILLHIALPHPLVHDASLADALAAMRCVRCGSAQAARRGFDGFDGGGWTAEFGAGGIRAAAEAIDLPGRPTGIHWPTGGVFLAWFSNPMKGNGYSVQ